MPFLVPSGGGYPAAVETRGSEAMWVRDAVGAYTYVVGYERSAPMGEQVERLDVVLDVEP